VRRGGGCCGGPATGAANFDREHHQTGGQSEKRGGEGERSAAARWLGRSIGASGAPWPRPALLPNS